MIFNFTSHNEVPKFLVLFTLAEFGTFKGVDINLVNKFLTERTTKQDERVLKILATNRQHYG